MKNFLAILALVSISSSGAFATILKCEINAWRAGAAGLLPSEQNIVLTTKVQSSGTVDESQCTQDTSLGYKLLLCARDADFIGGYEAAVISKDSKEQEPTFTVSSYGTLRNGKGLVYLDGTKEVLTRVSEKLFAANIQAPTELGPDSLQLDEAVADGVQKGILKIGEPIIIVFQSCKLEK